MFAFSNEYKINKPETSSITDAIEITKIWKAQIYQNMNSHLNCWKAKDVVAEGKSDSSGKVVFDSIELY